VGGAEGGTVGSILCGGDRTSSEARETWRTARSSHCRRSEEVVYLQ